MGGDAAPAIVVKGASLAHVRYPDVRFLLFGDEAKIKPLLAVEPGLAACCTIHHTAEVVTNDDKPSQVIRSGRQTSMWKAIESVKNGEAAGVVSAGNTGALMAMAILIMRTLPGVHRPAICCLLPTKVGETAMLDLGANAQCDARNLVEFAVMGECFSRAMLGLAQVLRSAHLDIEFKGFIEGDDIALGTVDVVVTDGFTGNVALKTMEGTAKLYSGFLRAAINSSLLAKIGMLLAKPVLAQVRTRTDPRRYNGALLVGLNGVVVKSHGGTDALGFSNAIGVAVDMVSRDLNTRIGEDLARIAADRAAEQAPAAAQVGP